MGRWICFFSADFSINHVSLNVMVILQYGTLHLYKFNNHGHYTLNSTYSISHLSGIHPSVGGMSRTFVAATSQWTNTSEKVEPQICSLAHGQS